MHSNTPGFLKKKDFELQAFYLCDQKNPFGIAVSPSRKLILEGVKA
jgi:hypothetical protein